MRTTSNILNHFLDLRKKRTAAAAVLTALSVVVAAGVFWQLRLTGISMTADPQCGYEIHTHGEGCSQVSVLNCDAGVHVHTDACRNEAGDLVCGKLDVMLHTHDIRCNGPDGALICTLTELAPHQHDDSCYTPTKVTVDPGHQHGESCYSYIKSELTTCGLEASVGHTHTDSCVTAVTYGCGQEESESHQHSAECGIQNGCGIPVSEGHTHTDACYPDVQNELICQEEVREPVTEDGEPELTCTRQVLQMHEHTDNCDTDGSLTCGRMELKSHQHTDACFRMETRESQCRIPEHTHTDDCYPDLKADVETAEDWEDTLPELQDNRWADNLIAVAQSQLGYAQSQRNFMAGVPGQPNHYTRYGQWAEEPYGDWRGQYISFCLHYAGIPEEAIPYGSDVADWAKELNELLVLPEKMAPQLGDVLFFDSDDDEIADAVGVLAEALPEEDAGEAAEAEPKLATLQGNVAGVVAEVEYDSEKVLSFLSLADAKVRYEQWLAEHPESTEPAETTAETTAEEDPTQTTECIECQATEPTGPVIPVVPETFTKTHEGSDYTITVTYGEEAQLPRDAELKVEELLPGSKDYEDYYRQVKEALGTDNLVYTRLFDVTFLVDGREVEPLASVNVSIQYHTALVPKTDQDTMAQVVHFAESGTEVLPAQVQEDDRGITEIAHTQDSFSIVAFALVVENKDNGPNKLLVDWYVFLDKKWTKVGSTRTGWRAETGETNDYISEQQVQSVLGPYGFTGGKDADDTLAFRKVKTYGADPVMEDGIWSLYGWNDGDQQVFYNLTQKSGTNAYCVYYAPNAKGIHDDWGTENSLYTNFGDDISIYTVKVYDPKNQDYHVGQARPSAYAMHGKPLSITVRKGDETDPLSLFSTRLDYLGGLTYGAEAANGDLGYIKSIENDSENQLLTITSVTRPLYIGRKSIRDEYGVDRTQPPDPLTVNYYVYLDGDWRRVATTHEGWTIDGRLEANKTEPDKMPYLDPNKPGTGAGYIKTDPNAATGLYARDAITMEQVVEVLGKYGFSPEVPNDPSSATGQNKVRISTLGYQPLDANGYEEVFWISFDTYYDYLDTLFFPLGQSVPRGKPLSPPKTPPGGYNIFYVPNGTTLEQSTNNRGSWDEDLWEQAAVARSEINFYVHLDGEWTRVGSTHYLCQGDESLRDKIGVQQIKETLHEYGFMADGNLSNAKELFFASDSGVITNGIGYSADNVWYQLDLPANAKDGYDIYWLPGTPDQDGNISLTDKTGTFLQLSVFDPSRSIYESLDVTPSSIVRYGATGTINVKIPSDPDGDGIISPNWELKGLDRNKVLVGQDDFRQSAENPKLYTATVNGTTYSRLENENGTYTFTVSPMKETVVVAFPFANGDRSLSNNYADADSAAALGDAVTDPNIVFTMHNYSTRINELLKNKGLASYSGSAGVDSATGNTVWAGQDVASTYFAFQGAGGIGLDNNSAVDADNFQPNHSTMKRNLYTGQDGQSYPRLNLSVHGSGGPDGAPMGFLWGDEATPVKDKQNNANSEVINSKDGTVYIKNYTEVKNTPLQIVNGQYRYFSYFNAADFNTREQKFYLRPYVERTEETATNHLEVDDYGDFLPFNHSGGELIHDQPYNFYEEDVDYWYGMTMRTRFYMPESGAVDNGKAMILGFSGGDDTYIYLDDMLVLDVGGTHSAATGTINFQTGLVQAYYDFDGVSAIAEDPDAIAADSRYYSTTIYEQYKAALEEQLGTDNPQVDEKLAEIFVAVTESGESLLRAAKQLTVTDARGVEYPIYRFKSYTTHDLDMFYMDRDSAVANFNLQFNLPTLPQAQLTVSLDTDYKIAQASADDHQFYSNLETHQFRIVDKHGNPLRGSLNAVYRVQNQDGSSGGTVYADINGIFRLRSNQRVVVGDIAAWVMAQYLDEYYVQELIPVQDIHKDLEVNGSPASSNKKIKIGDAEYFPCSYKVEVDRSNPKSAFAPFTNTRNLKDVGYLQISNKLLSGGTTCAEIFPIKITINGQLVPAQTKFYLVENGKIDQANYVRANENGEIVIGVDKVYQLGAKLMTGYTYDVLQQTSPKGWALDHYLHKTENKAEKKVDTGPVSGKITAGNIDCVTVINRTAPFDVTIELSTQFQGLDTGDQIQRTAVYKLEQVSRRDCNTGVCDGVFEEWTDTNIPVDLEAHSVKEITAVGSEPKTDYFQISYPSGLSDQGLYYRIRQVDLKGFPYGESFLPNHEEYIVKVTIGTYDGKQSAVVSAIYKDGFLIRGEDCGTSVVDGPSKLTFTNRRTGYRLPASGGPGVISYILGGTGCIGLALLMYNGNPLRKNPTPESTRGQRRRHHRPMR